MAPEASEARQASASFARLDATGTVSGQETLAIPNAGVGSHRALSWTGVDYAVASEQNPDGNYDVFLARLDTGGASLGTPIRITTAPGDSNESATALAADRVAVAWIDGRETSPAPWAAIECW